MDKSFPSAETRHIVLGTSLMPPFADNLDEAMFGMGCFWGAEKMFWQCEGVHTTMVGYAGGDKPDPTYESVCMGHTGHAEVVRVIYDPARLKYAELLQLFWEGHNPTQYNRQGNDVGTQYRSVLYYYGDEQKAQAEETRNKYSQRLHQSGHGEIRTAIEPAPMFYYAEVYHQQYLAANPGGYCGHGGVGVSLA